MTTGSYSYGGGNIQTGADFQFLKEWSGSDDRLNHRAENPYHCSGRRMSREKCNQYQLYPKPVILAGSTYVYDGSRGVGPLPSSNDELSALSKVAEDIRGHSFNAAVFTAELKESLGTIRNSTSAVRLLYKGVTTLNLNLVKHGLRGLPGQYDSKDLAKRLKAGDISGAWLAIRYGWQPLLQDIFEAAKAVESMTEQPRSLTYRGKKTVSSRGDTSNSIKLYNIPTTFKATVSYKVVLREVVTQSRQLGAFNPAAVLWEKLPYSFVVDWFIPIGNYLDLVGLFYKTEITWVKSVLRTASARSLPEQYAKNNTGYYRFVGGSYRCTSFQLDRTVGTDWIVPRPGLKLLTQAFSLGHIQNAAALMHQSISAMRDFSDHRPR